MSIQAKKLPTSVGNGNNITIITSDNHDHIIAIDDFTIATYSSIESFENGDNYISMSYIK